MNRGVYILGTVLLATGLLVPSNGCGGNNNTSVKSFSCLDTNKFLFNIPGTPNIKIRTTHCKDYIFKNDKMSSALHLFVSQFSREFNIPELTVWGYLENLEIEVSAIPKVVSNAYDMKGRLVKDAAVTGLALSPSKIWVEIKTNQIWSSSLAHELVHIIIWKQNSGIHADPDHEGSEYSGWSKQHTAFIKSFNEILLEKEI